MTTSQAPVETRSPRSTVQQEAFERLFRRIGEVSTFPAAATRIMRIASDDTKGVDDLLAAVECDPALAVKVLRTVNSTLYSVRRRVADLRTAVTMLGFDHVRNMALTVHVSQMFARSGDYRGYNRAKLWRHLVSTAATARLIAQACGSPRGDEAYTAGLLHDVGFILLDQHLRRPFKEVLDRLYDVEQADPLAAEREILSFDHAELGEYVARQWNFSESACAAAGFHHAPDEYRGDHADVVSMVAIANFLCTRHGISSLGAGAPPAVAQRAYQELDITAPRLQAILGKLDETLALADRAANV